MTNRIVTLNENGQQQARPLGFAYESIDRSGTTSATSEQITEVMAANVDRKKWFLQNTGIAEVILLRGESGSEVEFLRLKGGDSVSESLANGGINTDRIAIKSVAKDMPFIAWEGV